MTQIALFHPTSLLGAELREALGSRRELWHDVRLLTTEESEAGTLTEVAGAAAMVTRLDDDDLDTVDVFFCCGGIEPSRPLIERLPPAALAIVLSPDATPDDGHPVVAGINTESAASGRVLLSPHPGTVLLAHLLHPLRDFGIESVSSTLLQPVSVYSTEGLEEVFEQTRSILRFDPNPPREIFPIQLAFNVVAAKRAGHVGPLVATVLASEFPVACQVLQTSVFHSYGASVHVKLDDDPGPERVREALSDSRWIDLAVDPDILGMIDAAARDEVIVGHVEADPSGGLWIWAVMDNITCGGAQNALRILESVRAQTVH